MPMYVYEAKEGSKGCAKCRAGFEIVQSINDPKLTACPDCGGLIFRVSPSARAQGSGPRAAAPH